MAEEQVLQEVRQENPVAKIARWVICGVGGLGILFAVVMAAYRKFS